MNRQSPVSLLIHVGRIIRGRMDTSLPLPYGQCEVLRFAAEADEPSMRDVATHFNIAAPSATAVVEHLVREGYVTRTGNKKDRRVVRLMLTTRGVTLSRRILKTRERVLKDVLSVLNKEDVSDLQRVLGKIVSSA